MSKIDKDYIKLTVKNHIELIIKLIMIAGSLVLAYFMFARIAAYEAVPGYIETDCTMNGSYDYKEHKSECPNDPDPTICKSIALYYIDDIRHRICVDSKYKKGERVDLIYNKKNSTDIKIGSLKTEWFFGAVSIGIILIFIYAIYCPELTCILGKS